MKVKIFDSYDINDLETDINEFLSNNSITMIDIRYTSTDHNFSVLIMYK